MIKKAFIYFVLLTALMYGLRFLHYRGLLRQTKGYYGKYKTAFLEKNDFNVLFLGSSRVEMHYNTLLFDSLTGLNSFDLSMAGATPQVAFAALKAYLLKNKMPSYLIYEVDYPFLKNNSAEIKDFNNYFPFLSNAELRFQLNKIDSRMNHFYYNPYFSFPFVGVKNLSTGLHGWLNIPTQLDSLYNKGYFKESLRPNLNFRMEKPYFNYFDITNRNYLDSIILICKQNNTQITLVSSPIFGGGKIGLLNKAETILQINNIAQINRISYYDLSSLSFCNQRNLFVDNYHMNYRGATKYTLFFSEIFNNKMRIKPLK